MRRVAMLALAKCLSAAMVRWRACALVSAVMPAFEVGLEGVASFSEECLHDGRTDRWGLFAVGALSDKSTSTAEEGRCDCDDKCLAEKKTSIGSSLQGSGSFARLCRHAVDCLRTQLELACSATNIEAPSVLHVRHWASIAARGVNCNHLHAAVWV